MGEEQKKKEAPYLASDRTLLIFKMQEVGKT